MDSDAWCSVLGCQSAADFNALALFCLFVRESQLSPSLLCLISLFSSLPRTESFIKQLSSYEIITPLRVNDFGESFPHTLHFRRRRRSLNNDLPGLRVHYRIDAFGERFHLNLTADSGFIAPTYTVTHLGAEQQSSNGSTDSYFQDPADMRHCFFRGHVNAKSEHPAVFSLCTGLVSSLLTFLTTS